MSNTTNKMKINRDRIRVFFILYFLSDDYNSPDFPSFKKIFETEVKLQKQDFLLRNPDYFAYELLCLIESGDIEKIEAKKTIQNIFISREPSLRKLEMTRYLFGAWEYLDDVVAFLMSFGLVHFTSKRNSKLQTIDKKYYITQLAVDLVAKWENNWGELSWYVERCQLLKKYFGHFSGSQLKDRQYAINEYADTSYNEYIQDIQHKVKEKFFNMYGEPL